MEFALSSYLSSIAFGLFVSLLVVAKSKLFSRGYETLINLVCAGLYVVACIVDFNIFYLVFAALLVALSFRKGTFSISFATVVFVLLSAAILFSFQKSFSVIEILRTLDSSLLVGFVTQAMLLGHWYLVQPGLNRKPIKNLINISQILLILYVVLFLFWSNGMWEYIFNGKDDGWGGLFTIMWVGNIVLSVGLLIASSFSLKEKSYTAVMATTGLLYLAMVSVYATDIIFKAL